ncbi:MAG: hypothetical protein WCI22_13950, partial [Actinomycetota bacterium]
MAIDERNVSAGALAETSDAADSARIDATIEDLRRRLDSPLFARDAGIASAPQVPGLRELTWEHVINPTSQQPVITPELTPVPEAVSVSIEALLAAPVVPEPVIESPDSFDDIAFGSALSRVWPVSPAPAPASIDDAMLQITDRPPVARAADPVVAGLAELI